MCVLKGHKFGIVSVAFSSDMRHLASVGFQHDGYLNVWNWRKGTKVASNRVTSRVNAMAFAQDGTHFITAGLRHIKFWNLSSTGKSPLQVNILVDRLWEKVLRSSNIPFSRATSNPSKLKCWMAAQGF